MRILACEQRSEEWLQARRGIPTASDFSKIITPARGDYAAAADTLICELIDEVIRPDAPQSFTGNRHTERGNCLEGEALDVYAFERDVRLQAVGLILTDDGRAGASPDALVRADKPPELYAGGCEVKCPDGKTHVAWMRSGRLPNEHKVQVHGGLLVTGLPWWDFISYCPPYPLLVIRVVPDEFTAKLGAALQRFLGEYAVARKAIEEAVR